MTKFAWTVNFDQTQTIEKSYWRSVNSCKINPEGTHGLIWPEMVPFFLSCPWLLCGINQFVNFILPMVH